MGTSDFYFAHPVSYIISIVAATFEKWILLLVDDDARSNFLLG